MPRLKNSDIINTVDDEKAVKLTNNRRSIMLNTPWIFAYMDNHIEL